MKNIGNVSKNSITNRSGDRPRSSPYPTLSIDTRKEITYHDIVASLTRAYQLSVSQVAAASTKLPHQIIVAAKQVRLRGGKRRSAFKNSFSSTVGLRHYLTANLFGAKPHF